MVDASPNLSNGYDLHSYKKSSLFKYLCKKTFKSSYSTSTILSCTLTVGIREYRMFFAEMTTVIKGSGESQVVSKD